MTAISGRDATLLAYIASMAASMEHPDTKAIARALLGAKERKAIMETARYIKKWEATNS